MRKETPLQGNGPIVRLLFGIAPLLGVSFLLSASLIHRFDEPERQTSGEHLIQFEVASVRLNKEDAYLPNFPLNAGEAYGSPGGYFRATASLRTYIEFAYKLFPIAEEEKEMLAHAPRWIKTDAYRIEARAEGNPSKDQMRLMMQSLLADRFQFRAHFETREIPVFALKLAKAGKLGPKLVHHENGPACDDEKDSAATVIQNSLAPEGGGEIFPLFCNTVDLKVKPNGMLLLGYRNVTMDFVAASLSNAVGQGYPVTDETGLAGRYDFTLEWTRPHPATPDLPEGSPDALSETNSLTALRDQLGLKVHAEKRPVKILIVDKVERPSEN